MANVQSVTVQYVGMCALVVAGGNWRVEIDRAFWVDTPDDMPMHLNPYSRLSMCAGACALVVAGVLEDRIDRSARVDLPGGPLHIEWREADNHIYMTGPAELVFAGSVSL